MNVRREMLGSAGGTMEEVEVVVGVYVYVGCSSSAWTSVVAGDWGRGGEAMVCVGGDYRVDSQW